MKRLMVVLALLFSPALVSAQSAQVVDATVCEVLSNPESFNGKMIRLKGEVVAGFDEFAIKGSDCNADVNAIWLDYPEGTKAKAGPAALVELQLSKNNPSDASHMDASPVKLERNKTFNEFDSLLATPNKMSSICLGCARFTVSATLVGRLDGSKDVGAVRDANGKYVAVRGFGNLNRYPTRLVLQSVSEVISHEIDYSKAGVSTKDDVPGDSTAGNPMAAAHQLAQALGTGAAADQVERAAAAYGKEGDDNGVEIGFGVPNELSKNGEGKGTHNSPDGLLFNTMFNSDRLKGDALTCAISHMGTHIADIRVSGTSVAAMSLYDLEYHAWQTTVLSAIGGRHKLLTMPGGYQIWNAKWVADDRNKLIDGAISDSLAHWTSLKNPPQK